MSIYNNLIAVYPKAVSSDLCERVIDFFNNNEELVIDSGIASYTDKNGDKIEHKNPLDYRRSKEIIIHWPEKGTLVSSVSKTEQEAIALGVELKDIITPFIKEYMMKYPRLLPYKHTTRFEAAHLLKYKSNGGWYKFHADNDGEIIKNRIISIIVYLNDVEKGGETAFEYMDIDPVEPKKGDILIFPSGSPYSHRGNMPISNNKYIAVFWVNKDKPTE